MNETYVECLVACKKNSLASVFKFVLYGLAIACALWAFLGWVIMFIPAIAIALVAYYVMPGFDLEYEYLYLDKEVSIDKVTAKQRRKHVLTMDCNKVEKIAPLGSHELDQYNSREHVEKDFTSGMPDAKVYVFVYLDKEKINLIKLEPNQEMINAIKMVFPRKISEY